MDLKKFFVFKPNLKEWWNEIIHARSKASHIAAGIAVGFFIGMLPTPFLNYIIALIVIAVFRVNKLATVIGVALVNPISYIVLGGLSYLVGEALLPHWHAITKTMIGQIPVALIGAIILYVITYMIFYHRNSVVKKAKHK